MELTYKVRGADGKEYGPVSLEQISAWLHEDRIAPDSEVTRSDMSHWARAQDFTELQGVAPAQPAAYATTRPALPKAAAVNPRLAARVKGGASWFYWIAGLSLVNSLVALSGSNWRFMLGLGATEFFDAIGRETQGGGKMIVLFLDVLVAGIFILFGVFANKRHTWAFITGMILFALDACLTLLFQDWLSLAFHAYALFRIFGGFTACRELKQISPA